MDCSLGEFCPGCFFVKEEPNPPGEIAIANSRTNLADREMMVILPEQF
jgi:hypothetical protein